MMQQFYPQVQHSYRFELNKDMHFSAAHFIPNEDAGKCQVMHGHTYYINVTIGGNELDSIGFLIDFKQLKNLIHDKYDHSVLNDHPEFKNTSRRPSDWQNRFATQFRMILRTRNNKPVCLQVIVRETPTSYVIYRPEQEESL